MMDERGVVIVPGPFQGLDRFEARPALLAALAVRWPGGRPSSARTCTPWDTAAGAAPRSRSRGSRCSGS